jgi:hypothetical protein
VVGWVLLGKHLGDRYPAVPATAWILTFGTVTLAPVALLWEGVPRLDLTQLCWASVLVFGGHLRTVELGRGARARLTRWDLLEPRAAGGGVAGDPGPWGGVGTSYDRWRRAYRRRRLGRLAPQ